MDSPFATPRSPRDKRALALFGKKPQQRRVFAENVTDSETYVVTDRQGRTVHESPPKPADSAEVSPGRRDPQARVNRGLSLLNRTQPLQWASRHRRHRNLRRQGRARGGSERMLSQQAHDGPLPSDGITAL